MIFHLLTAVLFVLKVLDVIQVSWWLVLAPSLTVILIWLAIILILGSLALAAWAKS